MLLMQDIFQGISELRRFAFMLSCVVRFSNPNHCSVRHHPPTTGTPKITTIKLFLPVKLYYHLPEPTSLGKYHNTVPVYGYLPSTLLSSSIPWEIYGRKVPTFEQCNFYMCTFLSSILKYPLLITSGNPLMTASRSVII